MTDIQKQELMMFLNESNKIEGIMRAVTEDEIKAALEFIAAPMVTCLELQKLVSVFQPGAKLRNEVGMDVKIGKHVPMLGGQQLVAQVIALLDYIEGDLMSPHEAHHRYETLHPFMDGNGRSGRMLWLSMHLEADTYLGLEFLHQWYYESLDARGGTRPL